MPVLVAAGTFMAGTAGATAMGAGLTATLGALGIGAVGGLIASQVSAAKSASKAAKTANSIMSGTQGITGTVDNTTTVDPNTNANGITNVNQLGRAALISTSPQGVKGTDETGRYRLLGN